MPAKKANVVYAVSKPSRCYNCDSKIDVGAIVLLKNSEDEREVLCQSCAGLGDMKVVSSGNAKVTNRCKKYSQVYYVIMQWSELWKTYERKGLLVEAAALERALSEAGG